MGYGFEVAKCDESDVYDREDINCGMKINMECPGCKSCSNRGPTCPRDIYRGKWLMRAMAKFLPEHKREKFLWWYSKADLESMVIEMEGAYKQYWIEYTYGESEGDDYDDGSTAFQEYVAAKNAFNTKQVYNESYKQLEARTIENEDWNLDFWQVTEALIFLYHCIDNNCGMYVN